MSRRRWLSAALASALVPPLLVIGTANPSQAAPSSRGNLKLVKSLTPTGTTTVAKSPTSRLAQTDKALLNRTDSTKISIVVKLAYDSTSTYSGDVAGFAATS